MFKIFIFQLSESQIYTILPHPPPCPEDRDPDPLAAHWLCAASKCSDEPFRRIAQWFEVMHNWYQDGPTELVGSKRLSVPEKRVET